MNKSTTNPSPKNRFMWTEQIEVNTDARIKGDRMSLSDGEVIIDALNAYRNKAVEELEWLFKNIVAEELHKPDRLKELLESDCTYALNVVKCCDLYSDMIASGAMADLRMISAQHPDLSDNPGHE